MRHSLCIILDMESSHLSIGELADAAGLSRRAVRFYVQRGLLPPPLGRGRGPHYDTTHVQRMQQLQQLQAAGHSLDAIAKIFGGEAAPSVPPPKSRRVRPALTAELWTHLVLAPGVELQFDTDLHNPTVETLLALQQAVRQILHENKANES